MSVVKFLVLNLSSNSVYMPPYSTLVAFPVVVIYMEDPHVFISIENAEFFHFAHSISLCTSANNVTVSANIHVSVYNFN